MQNFSFCSGFFFLKKKNNFLRFVQKVPSLARSVLKPLKVPGLARSVPKSLLIFAVDLLPSWLASWCDTMRDTMCVTVRDNLRDTMRDTVRDTLGDTMHDKSDRIMYPHLP